MTRRLLVTTMLFGLSVNAFAQTAPAAKPPLPDMRLLLSKGADPAKANNRGEPPIILATKSKRAEAVSLLLQQGVDVNVANTSSNMVRNGPIAMLLSCVPVFFLVLWSYEVLNYNLKAWFTNPVDNQVEVYKKAARALELEIQQRLRVQAALLAAQPETSQVLAGGPVTPGALDLFAKEQGLDSAAILTPSGTPLATWGPYPARGQDAHIEVVRVPLRNGSIELAARIPLDAAQQLTEIKKFSDDWAQIVGNRRDYRTLYVMRRSRWASSA